MKLISNIKFLWIVILVLIILNLASITAVWLEERDNQDPVMRDPARIGRREHFLKERLNFTFGQQAQFDSLLTHHRSELEATIEEIRSLREELMGMMKNQEFTTGAEEIVRQIGEKQSELELLNYRHFKEVLTICNDEQKQIFLETVKRAVGPRQRQTGREDRIDDFRKGARKGRR
ncbi:MAG: periplasmic heavy metal sensor [Cyclobacteriaceae bacterium]|nr:periplasmic heavy metal sensor [Cyclobacteriaceae bacterium]